MFKLNDLVRLKDTDIDIIHFCIFGKEMDNKDYKLKRTLTKFASKGHIVRDIVKDDEGQWLMFDDIEYYFPAILFEMDDLDVL